MYKTEFIWVSKNVFIEDSWGVSFQQFWVEIYCQSLWFSLFVRGTDDASLSSVLSLLAFIQLTLQIFFTFSDVIEGIKNVSEYPEPTTNQITYSADDDEYIRGWIGESLQKDSETLLWLSYWPWCNWDKAKSSIWRWIESMLRTMILK